VHRGEAQAHAEALLQPRVHQAPRFSQERAHLGRQLRLGLGARDARRAWQSGPVGDEIFEYFRQAQLGSFAAAYAALGTQLTRREVVEVDDTHDEVVCHVGWG